MQELIEKKENQYYYVDFFNGWKDLNQFYSLLSNEYKSI